MKKLTTDEEEKLKREFLKTLGKKIRLKREQKNISLSTLSDCINVSVSSLSQYENGKEDMKVSKLPLISTYCGFSLIEYFDRDMAKTLSDTFSQLVEITKKKYQRNATAYAGEQYIEGVEFLNPKRLKAYIYETDRGDEIVYAKQKSQTIPLKQKYLRGYIDVDADAFTEDEFIEYLKNNQNYLSALEIAKNFLDYIGDSMQKETIKNNIAEFIISEIVIAPVSNNYGDIYKRAYAYYKKLLINQYNNPQKS